MKKIALGVLSASLLLLASGCCTNAGKTPETTAATAVKAAAGEIRFDGRLSEKFWQKVPAYELVRTDRSNALPPREKARVLADGLEKCTVKFAYDDKYFYAAAVLQDNDLVAMGKNCQKLYNLGDTFAIFLAPEKSLHCWEFYTSPNGSRTALLYHINALYLEIKDKEKYGIIPEFETACSLDGTLNKQNDRDKSWSIEMRLPLEYIAKEGVKFAPGEKWRILVARYNYSAYNYYVQTSSFPGLPMMNFQMKQCYAPLILR